MSSQDPSYILTKRQAVHHIHASQHSTLLLVGPTAWSVPLNVSTCFTAAMLAPPIPVPTTLMAPMPTATSLRYSRRSACDRCRAYKLRCQRDERFGKPCERCAKSRLACTTTFDPATSSASLSSAASAAVCQASRPNPVPHAQTQQQNGNGQIQVDSREQQALLPSRERLHSPPDQRDRRHSSFAHSQREHDNERFQRQGEVPPEPPTDIGRNDNTSSDSMLLDSNSLV